MHKSRVIVIINSVVEWIALRLFLVTLINGFVGSISLRRHKFVNIITVDHEVYSICI